MSAVNSVAVLIPCSGRKQWAPDAALTARSLPLASQREVEQEWLRRLATAAPIATASSLYNGTGFVLGLRAARLLGARLYVISAGLGLIDSSRRVPSYGATVAPGKDDTIRTTDRFNPAAWWAALQAGPYATALDRVIQDHDEVHIALSANYAALIADDLRHLPHLERIRLYCADARKLSPHVAARAVPRLTAAQAATVPGSKMFEAQLSLLFHAQRRAAS